MVGINEPKTVGALAEKNRTDKIRRGEIDDRPSKVTPWWRKGQDKPNYEILKNPTKYIETGKV